jgi:Asp-tRNA(Asn)/Glu-tRNA(Gln) amidotransferase B subunit
MIAFRSHRSSTPAANFLTGQVMKLSRGKANPKMVTETILKKLRS